MNCMVCFLLSDTENNFPYFNRVLNFSGTIMVQFKANYRKIKQRYPYQDNITHGSCLHKNR
jgi:hypothetical protein